MSASSFCITGERVYILYTETSWRAPWVLERSRQGESGRCDEEHIELKKIRRAKLELFSYMYFV